MKKPITIFILICLLVGTLNVTTPLQSKAEIFDDPTHSMLIIVKNQDNKPIRYHYRPANVIPTPFGEYGWDEKIYVKKDDSSFDFAIIPPPIDYPPQNEYVYDFSNEWKQRECKVWIQIIDVSREKEILTETLEPGKSDITISGLKAGRYLVRAGTVIQIDEKETKYYFFDPSGTLPAPPSIEYFGKDERGSWECVKATIRLLSNAWEIEIIKRYTYNIVSSTYTYIAHNEKTDCAFILLPTDPNMLGSLAGSIQVLERYDISEELTSAIIEETIEEGVEKTMKYSFPKIGEVGGGLVITSINNIIYLASNFDQEADINFVKVAGSYISWGIGIIVGGIIIGGPVGAVVAFAIGVAGDAVTDFIVKEMIKAKIKERFSIALFDDIFLEITNIRDDVCDVKITPMGLPIYNVFLGIKTAIIPEEYEYLCGKNWAMLPWGKISPVSSILEKIESGSSAIIKNMPLEFMIHSPQLECKSSQIMAYPLLVCDAGLYISEGETHRFKELYWYAGNLMGWNPIDISITSYVGRTIYKPGDTVRIEIKITNKRDTDIETWVSIDVVDSKGNKYEFPLTHIILSPDKTKTLITQWIIPLTAELGDYKLYITCWKDKYKTDIYLDDFSPTYIFSVCNMRILSPTSSVYVNPDRLNSFTVEIFSNYPLYFFHFYKANFEIRIGNKLARWEPAGPTFSMINNILNNIWTVRVYPPSLKEGVYDLKATLKVKNLEITDIRPNVIVYSSESGNVDTVIVIDRSGSMGWEDKLQKAKNAATTFVKQMTTGDYIGICSFDHYSYINYQLTEITSQEIKDDAENAINSITLGGYTSIGAGLQAALNQFTNYGNPYHPWYIVLITDGQENRPPYVNDILPQIKASNIAVYTIGLGSDADADLLRYIAEETGGEYYYAPTPDELAIIYNAISGKIKAKSIVKTIKGFSQKGIINTEQVYIDKTVDEVTFTITWDTGNIETTIKRPDGTIVKEGDTDLISHYKGTYHEIYTIDDPLPGKWKLDITTPLSDPEYSIVITAETNITLDLFTDKDNYYINEPMHIITILSHNGTGITGAIVNASIEKPDGSVENITLFDDGLHGDMFANDGVYANYFLNSSMEGSYIITAYAKVRLDKEDIAREVTKSITVFGLPSDGIEVSPVCWKTPLVHDGEYAVGIFTVNSTATEDIVISLSATEFINDSQIIKPDNVLFVPQTFLLPASNSTNFYAIFYIPRGTETGNYTGNIVLTSTANSINIPVTLCIEKLQPILKINLEDNPSKVLPENNLTYHIIITNEGNAPAIDVIIREYYDENFIPLEFDPMPTEGNNTWFIESIAPGETKEIKITGKVLGGKDVIYDLVHYYSSNGGWGRIEEYTTILYAEPHIEIKAPTEAEAGEDITCKLIYYNAGNLNISNVTIKFFFPHMQMIYDSSSYAEWFENILAGNSGVEREILLRIDSPLDNGTVIPLYAEFISDEFYLNCTKYITIHSSPHLLIGIEDSVDPVHERDNLTYYVTVMNNGNMNATNVIITFDYDETPLEIMETNGTDDGSKITWTVNIPAGKTITYEIKARVKDIQNELIATNYVEACCSYDRVNNVEYTTLLPILLPNFEIDGYCLERVEKNCIITYKLNITNVGEGEGVATITFDYDETSLEIMETNGTDDGSKITWTVNIPAGKTITYEIKARVKMNVGSILCIAGIEWNGNTKTKSFETEIVNMAPTTETIFHGSYSSKTKWGYTLYYISPSTYITLEASDEPKYSSVANIYYRIWKYDGKWKIIQDWKEYNGEKIRFSEINKKYCIDFYSIDIAGNKERMKSIEVLVKENINGLHGIKSIPGFEIIYLLAAILLLAVGRKKKI